MTRGAAAVAVCLSASLPACASAYVASADREGAAIQREKMDVVEGFRKTQLVDPRGEVRGRDRAPPPIEVPAVVSLEDAVRIATKHNRDYLSQREGIFLSALSLGIVRRDFERLVFSGSLAYSGTLPRGTYTDSTSLSVSGSGILPDGTDITISGSGSLSNADSPDGRDQSVGVTGSVTLSRPLLRGGRRWIRFEALTQAEREMVYAARAFEEFRQRFAIDVLQQYYSLVSQKRQLRNNDERVKRQEHAVRQARALYQFGTQSQIDVFLAEQSLADARNSGLDAQQGYQVALDRFKIFLGLPTDVQFEVGDDLPGLEELDFDTDRAVVAALQNRLDFQTTRERLEDATRALKIAKDALLPSLDLTASYSVLSDPANSFADVEFRGGAATLGATLEIPLDRKAERNAYRTALINMDRARRSFQQTEDGVILEVRDTLRSLRRQRSQLAIEARNIESLGRRVLQAQMENLGGLRTNRDVVEANDQLTAAQNAQLDRYVSHEINRLRLLQALGLLFVDEAGRIVR